MTPKDLAEAKESALRLLARREHGAYELKQKLLERGYQASVIEQVIELLKRIDLQSDERFVESYIHRRTAKGFGPLHIHSELSKLRLSTVLIEEKMAVYDLHWAEILKDLCCKKYGSNCLARDLNAKAKQIRFFQSRGFDFSLINEVLAGRM